MAHNNPPLMPSLQGLERASNPASDELVSGNQSEQRSCCYSIFHSIYGAICAIQNAIVSCVRWIFCCGKKKEGGGGDNSDSSSASAKVSKLAEPQPSAPVSVNNLAETKDKWNRLLVSFRETREASGQEGRQPLEVVWPVQFDQLPAEDQTTLLKQFMRMCAPKEIEKGKEGGYVATEQEISNWVEESYPEDTEGRNTKFIATQFVRNLQIHQGRNPQSDDAGVPALIGDIVAELDRQAAL